MGALEKVNVQESDECGGTTGSRKWHVKGNKFGVRKKRKVEKIPCGEKKNPGSGSTVWELRIGKQKTRGGGKKKGNFSARRRVNQGSCNWVSPR